MAVAGITASIIPAMTISLTEIYIITIVTTWMTTSFMDQIIKDVGTPTTTTTVQGTIIIIQICWIGGCRNIQKSSGPAHGCRNHQPCSYNITKFTIRMH